MDRIKVAIVDDQRLFREGLAHILRNNGEVALLAEFGDGRELMEALPTMRLKPDVLLVDMNMPEMTGAEVTERVHKLYPSIKIIILTVYDQDRFINKVISTGAAGYLLKDRGGDEVINAIKGAHKTGFYFNETVLKAMKSGIKADDGAMRNISNSMPIDITDREKEVLLLICGEFTNTEIAERLYISPRTVDGHRNNLLAKTGSRNTAGLVLFAVSNHIYDIMH